MPLPDVTELESLLLKAPNHRANVYLTIVTPRVILTAKINGSPGRGAMQIQYHDGTGSGIGYIREGNTLEVDTPYGTVEVRIRTHSGSQSTGTMDIAPNGIEFTPDMVIRVLQEFPLRRKLNRFTSSQFYRDWDVTYTDQNNQTSPVCIAGPHKVCFLGGETATKDIDLTDSYPTRSPATIASYSAASLRAGVAVSLNSSTGLGTLTTDTPDQYWIEYGCTDTNGKTQKTYRQLIVCSKDPDDPTYPYTDFTVEGLNGDRNRGGWNLRIKVNGVADTTLFPDRALAILWYDVRYGAHHGYIGGIKGGENILFAGYIRSGSVQADWDYGTVGFEAFTIDEELRSLANRSVLLRASAAPTTWNDFHNGLTNTLGVWHIARWCSNLLDVADVYGLASSDQLRSEIIFQQGNLYSMMNDLLSRYSIRHQLASNQAGQLKIIPLINLQSDADRAEYTTIYHFTRENWMGQIDVTETMRSKVAQVSVSGMKWDGTNASTHCAMSPGDYYEESGVEIQVIDRQTAKDQADMNSLAGRHSAVGNRRYTNFRFKPDGIYAGILDIASPNFYELEFRAEDNTRRLAYDGRVILNSVNIQVDNANGYISSDITLDPEAIGPVGVPVDCITGIPGAFQPGDNPNNNPKWETPSTLKGKGVFIQGSSGFYYWDNRSSLWTQRNGGLSGTNIQDSHGAYDPWSTTSYRNNTTNPDQAVLWKTDDANVFVSADSGKTWSPISSFANYGLDYFQVLPSPFNSEHTFVLAANATKGFVFRYSYGSQETIWAPLGEPDALLYPIWMAVNSAKLYVGVWTGNKLWVHIFDPASLSYEASYDFGGCSVMEFQAGEYTAFPVTVLDTPNVLYVAGRFRRLPGDEEDSNIYVAKLDIDTWSVIEDTWDTGVCSAFHAGIGVSGSRKLRALRSVIGNGSSHTGNLGLFDSSDEGWKTGTARKYLEFKNDAGNPNPGCLYRLVEPPLPAYRSVYTYNFNFNIPVSAGDTVTCKVKSVIKGTAGIIYRLGASIYVFNGNTPNTGVDDWIPLDGVLLAPLNDTVFEGVFEGGTDEIVTIDLGWFDVAVTINQSNTLQSVSVIVGMSSLNDPYPPDAIFWMYETFIDTIQCDVLNNVIFLSGNNKIDVKAQLPITSTRPGCLAVRESDNKVMVGSDSAEDDVKVLFSTNDTSWQDITATSILPDASVTGVIWIGS